MRRLTESQIAALLHSTPLFREAPKARVDGLARFVKQEQLVEGQVLFHRNAAADRVYLIVDGRIMLKLPSRNGQELLIGTLEGGELLGELALLEDTKRIVTAVADRRSFVLSVSRRKVLPLLTENLDFALSFARILAGHLRSTLNNLGSVGLNDAKTRLWVRLMALSRRHGRVDSETGRLRIDHKLSQQNLADSIGTTRVMVNRQLSVWQHESLVEYGRGYIEIPDPIALEAAVWATDASESKVA